MRFEIKRKERTRREYCFTLDAKAFVLKDFIYAFESSLPKEYTLDKRAEEYHVCTHDSCVERLAARIKFYRHHNSPDMSIIIRRAVPSRWLGWAQDWEKDKFDEAVEMVLGRIPPKSESQLFPGKL